MDSYYFWAALILIGTILVIATILLNKSNRRWLKYTPSITAALVTIALAVKTFWFSEGFEGLGYLIMMMIIFVLFILAMITAVILEIINRRKMRTGKEPEGHGRE